MNKVTIFSDGSYLDKDKSCGYGLVILDTDNARLIKVGGKIIDPELISMWNVGGEIMGATKAIEFCIDNNIPELELIYDYKGLEAWVNGEWKIRKNTNPAIVRYVEYVNKCIDTGLKINFKLIKGHTHKIHNMADEYANLGRYAKVDKPIMNYEDLL